MRTELAKNIIRALWRADADESEKVVQEIIDDVAIDTMEKTANVEFISVKQRMADMEERLRFYEDRLKALEFVKVASEVKVPESKKIDSVGTRPREARAHKKVCEQCGELFTYAGRGKRRYCDKCRDMRVKMSGQTKKALDGARKAAGEDDGLMMADAETDPEIKKLAKEILEMGNGKMENKKVRENT